MHSIRRRRCGFEAERASPEAAAAVAFPWARKLFKSAMRQPGGAALLCKRPACTFARGMRFVLALLVLVACMPVGAASAATVGGKTIEDEDGNVSGTMRYRAGHAIANRLTITDVSG